MESEDANGSVAFNKATGVTLEGFSHSGVLTVINDNLLGLLHLQAGSPGIAAFACFAPHKTLYFSDVLNPSANKEKQKIRSSHREEVA